MALKNIASIGLMYPLFAVGKGNQNVSLQTLDAVKTDIITLLSTRLGERVMQPTLGIPIDKYLFEPDVDSSIEGIKTDITEAIAFWLPFVTTEEVIVTTTTEDKDRNKFRVQITFSIKSIPDKLESVTLTI